MIFLYIYCGPSFIAGVALKSFFCNDYRCINPFISDFLNYIINNPLYFIYLFIFYRIKAGKPLTTNFIHISQTYIKATFTPP